MLSLALLPCKHKSLGMSLCFLLSQNWKRRLESSWQNMSLCMKRRLRFYCLFCFTSRSRTHDCRGQDNPYRGSLLAHWYESECIVEPLIEDTYLVNLYTRMVESQLEYHRCAKLQFIACQLWGEREKNQKKKSRLPTGSVWIFFLSFHIHRQEHKRTGS